ncbi:MAG: glycogen debranching protein GlgX [bacterium]|nr:glycogen debranching protein GlgX [bacterium]
MNQSFQNTETLGEGSPFPLGASVLRGGGVNFALYAGHAEGVELCIFELVPGGGFRESRRYRLEHCTDGVWHGVCAAAGPNWMYAFRVYGPEQPGFYFDPHRPALDPYARRLAADPNDPIVRVGGPPPAVVPGEDDFEWGADRPPRIAWGESVIYEAHVKGLTAAHEQVPPEERGTFAGAASDVMLEYYRELGVTALELLPVQQRLDETHLVLQGLTNYWGYNTIAFFVPDERFRCPSRPGDAAYQLKDMVRRLHAAGIEVILDIVFNHTAEGGTDQPAFSQRLIDNQAYYRTHPDDPARYHDVTGCGNTLNADHPRVVQWIMDCLRYWIHEFHVDGFRFDLAGALGRRSPDREGGAFDSHAPLFAAILQDPVVSRVKLIAEPWDAAEDGYYAGRFAEPFFEWNDRFRDTLRRFWRGDDVPLHETTARLAGSGDIFSRQAQGVHTGINFITAHDGFTLNDLVSYNEKHNAANGEENRDGHDNNYSWNFGVEGPVGLGEVDFEIRERRRRQMRNLMATFLLSRGVPMLAAGDEVWRTQGGNNNAYCQDNAVSWLDWNTDEPREEFRNFVRDLLKLRHEQRALREFRRHGETGVAGENVRWLLPNGFEPGHDDWTAARREFSAVFFPNGEIPRPEDPRRVMLILVNAGHEARVFRLPELERAVVWERLFDTVHPGFDRGAHARPGGEEYHMSDRSVAVFVLR